MQQADDLFLKGKALLKEGKKKEAVEAYRAAWKLRKSFDLAGNLGSLEVELGLFRDAADHMSYALSHYAASSTSKEQLEKAKQRFEAARKEVGALHLTVNVEGAEVLVDGVSAGHAPLEDSVFVEAGKRTVEARLAGHVTATKALDVKKGATEEVKLELVPVPALVPSATGSANGTPSATASAVPAELPRSKVPAYVLGGVGLVGVVLGAALLATSSSELANAEDKYRTVPKIAGRCVARVDLCNEIDRMVRTSDTLGNAAVGMFVGAGVVAAGAVGYWLYARREPQRAGVQAAPMVGAGVGGIVVRGAW